MAAASAVVGVRGDVLLTPVCLYPIAVGPPASTCDPALALLALGHAVWSAALALHSAFATVVGIAPHVRFALVASLTSHVPTSAAIIIMSIWVDER